MCNFSYILRPKHVAFSAGTMAKKPHLTETDNGAFISRRKLAERWECSLMTLKRRERTGELTPFVFSSTMIRYRLTQVEAVELAHEEKA